MMTVEETKDELYRLLSNCVNGAYPLRNNAQRGRYRKAVGVAIRSLEAWDKVKEELTDKATFDNVDDLVLCMRIINKHLKEVEENG